MTLTMKDIAKLANVSQPTVSRVINGNPNVNKEAAERVLKVIEESGYKPNRSAQTLKNNCSYLTGLNVVDIINPYFMELIDALESKGRENGYNIILHNCRHDDPQTEWDNIQNFIARQADGIFMVPTTELDVNRLARLRIPIVMVTQIREGFDSIAISHLKGGALVAEHFIEKGHHRFLFIGPTTDEKLLGFKEVLYNNGFSFSDGEIIDIDDVSPFLLRQGIQSYFEQHPDPEFTAVFCYNDVTACEFIKVIEDAGKRASEFAIASFDDTILARALSITSVHQPIKEMAGLAFQMLLRRINEGMDLPPQHAILDPMLMIRKSTQ